MSINNRPPHLPRWPVRHCVPASATTNYQAISSRRWENSRRPRPAAGSSAVHLDYACPPRSDWKWRRPWSLTFAATPQPQPKRPAPSIATALHRPRSRRHPVRWITTTRRAEQPQQPKRSRAFELWPSGGKPSLAKLRLLPDHPRPPPTLLQVRNPNPRSSLHLSTNGTDRPQFRWRQRVTGRQRHRRGPWPAGAFPLEWSKSAKPSSGSKRNWRRNPISITGESALEAVWKTTSSTTRYFRSSSPSLRPTTTNTSACRRWTRIPAKTAACHSVTATVSGASVTAVITAVRSASESATITAALRHWPRPLRSSLRRYFISF